MPCAIRTPRCSTISCASAPRRPVMSVVTQDTDKEVGPAGRTPERRSRWDVGDISVRLIVAMLVLTVVIAVLGWQYRPAGGGYPVVSRRLAITVDAEARSLVLTLARTGDDGAVLTLYDDDRFAAGPQGYGVTPGGWAVGLDGLASGRVVRDPGPGVVPIPADQSRFDHLR